MLRAVTRSLSPSRTTSTDATVRRSAPKRCTFRSATSVSDILGSANRVTRSPGDARKLRSLSPRAGDRTSGDANRGELVRYRRWSATMEGLLARTAGSFLGRGMHDPRDARRGSLRTGGLKLIVRH